MTNQFWSAVWWWNSWRNTSLSRYLSHTHARAAFVCVFFGDSSQRMKMFSFLHELRSNRSEQGQSQISSSVARFFLIDDVVRSLIDASPRGLIWHQLIQTKISIMKHFHLTNLLFLVSNLVSRIKEMNQHWHQESTVELWSVREVFAVSALMVRCGYYISATS